jgi:hypothetical protein
VDCFSLRDVFNCVYLLFRSFDLASYTPTSCNAKRGHWQNLGEKARRKCKATYTRSSTERGGMCKRVILISNVTKCFSLHGNCASWQACRVLGSRV